MREAIIIRNKELGLAVDPIYDFRDLVAEALQPVAYLVQIGRCPIKSDSFVVLWLDRGARALVEPKDQVLTVVNHTANELSVAPHLSIDGKTETLDPKAEALFDVGTGDHGETGFNDHGRRASLRLSAGRTTGQLG